MTRRLAVRSLLAVLGALILALAGCGTGGRSGDNPTITVYTVGGLESWYQTQFEKFTKDTGIKVDLFVAASSGEVVSRLNSGGVWDRLSDNDEHVEPADLVVTLPPFIQKAEKAGLLQPSGVDTTGMPTGLIGSAGKFVPILQNALCFIVNPGAQPRPVTWEDLLAPRFKGKLQYSTPGEAGDGTAVLVLLQHLMGKQGARDYLAKLKTNNVGPEPSTGLLQPKVSSGELLVANGDVQMNLASINNDNSNFEVFFPAMPDNSRTTVSLPYFAGVTAAARWPEEAKKLLAFLLSDDAQRNAYTEAFGIPIRGSVNAADTGPRTPGGVLKGVTQWAPDWNVVLAELESDIAAYQAAVR